jgi:hypothetical protein
LGFLRVLEIVIFRPTFVPLSSQTVGVRPLLPADYLISRGGMGIVYRATNLALRRIYALKVLAPELADDVQFRDRFKREIRIAASLNHPNVVGIHYAGEHEGLLFLAMDLVDGTGGSIAGGNAAATLREEGGQRHFVTFRW